MTKRWTNDEVANLLRRIADMLQIKGEVVYKSIAYRRAADNIAALGLDLHEVQREGNLRDIPGVGQALSKKLTELLTTGRLQYYERLEEQVPPAVLSLLAIPDVGPKTVKLMWERLGIMSVAEAERAARSGELRHLPGLGQKSEQRILRGIQLLHRRSERIPLGTAWPLAQELLAALTSLPDVERVAAAGSLRRMRATVGDLDLLIASREPAPVMAAFGRLPQVERVDLSGDTKTTVILRNGLQVDLRVLPPARYGSLLQYFTGSQAHNVRLRGLAQDRGLSLSEYGFKRDDEEILCPEEIDVYQTLGLQLIPPELREDRGEIEAAEQGRLPDLVELGDLRGDLHCHSDWSDGACTIEEMALAAIARGYEYLLISDHTQSLGIANGLNVERLRQQQQAIASVNARHPGFRLLHGCELEIMADGSLDFPDQVLAELDIVVASIHSGLRQDRDTITRRVLSAVRNPHVDIIGHPTGRLLGQREPSEVDIEAVLREAARHGTIIEVNAIPARLDLDDVYIRQAKDLGVRLAVNSDAHSIDGLDTIRFGIATARRGWAEARDIVNTLPIDNLLALLK